MGWEEGWGEKRGGVRRGVGWGGVERWGEKRGGVDGMIKWGKGVFGYGGEMGEAGTTEGVVDGLVDA